MSSDASAIIVSNISKAYRIWESPAARLTTPLLEAGANLLPSALPLAGQLRRKAASSRRDFWALRDVSFEIKRGEAVGIIGRNGSGKSTLLQVIARTLQPTSGSVSVNGRVAALLELGSGFNPEFTGRENVYLYAAVLGLSKAEVDARFDTIAAFADIGDFLDQPVKTYSSGMTVRLAFAVSAHVDADILIVDEALGVGDARFQLKCARTIDQLVADGRTLLFVSHDMNSVRRLCAQALLLESGTVLYRGTPNNAVNLYSKLLTSPTGAADISEDIRRLGESSTAPAARDTRRAGSPAAVRPAVISPAVPIDVEKLRTRVVELETQLEQIALAAKRDAQADTLLESERAGYQPASDEYTYGGELGQIVSRSLYGTAGIEKTTFTSGEQVELRLSVEARETLVAPIYAMTLKSIKGQEVYGTNTAFSNQPAPGIASGERATVVFSFPLNLAAGEYFVSLGWTHWIGDELVVIHRRYDTIRFTVLGLDRSFGIAQLFAKIEVNANPPVQS